MPQPNPQGNPPPPGGPPQGNPPQGNPPQGNPPQGNPPQGNPPPPGGGPGGGGGAGGGGGGGAPGGGGSGGGGQPVPPRRPRRPRPNANNNNNNNPQNMQNADPAVVALLNRLVTAEEKKKDETEENRKINQKFTMFPTEKFDGSDPGKAYDHWVDFMRYYRYATDTGVLTRDDYPQFVRVFELSLSGIAITWFRGMKDKYNNVQEFKAAFLGRFNRWGQTGKQLTHAWNTLRFDMQKSDLDKFTLDLRLLGDILHMTPQQALEKFIDSFDSEISAHLLEVQDIETAQTKAQQLIFLYQNKQSNISSNTMLLHDKAKPRVILEHELAQRNDYANNSQGQGNKDSTDRNARPSNQGQNKPQSNYSNRGRNWRGNNNMSYRGRSFGRGNRGRFRGRNNYYTNNGQQRQNQFYTRPRARQGPPQWRNRSSNGYPYRRGSNRQTQPQGIGHPSYNGIPQHRYVCTLCSNRGHYDHQCHYAQQVMNHATAASIKAQQQEDSAYQYEIQNAYADQTHETYDRSQPQEYVIQPQQPQNL